MGLFALANGRLQMTSARLDVKPLTGHRAEVPQHFGSSGPDLDRGATAPEGNALRALTWRNTPLTHLWSGYGERYSPGVSQRGLAGEDRSAPMARWINPNFPPLGTGQ